MEQQTTMDVDLKVGGKRNKKGSGRKDKDGIEGTPDYAVVKEKSPNLMKLFRRKKNADDEYREGVKGLAQSTNTNASSIQALVKASYKGEFKDAQRKIDQQSEMFSEVGEVAGGAPAE